MIRIAPLVIALLLVGGCAGNVDPGADTAETDLGAIGWIPPTECPVTAAEVALLVGRELPEESVPPGEFSFSCRFTDGVGTVDIALSPPDTGALVFEDSRAETARQYGSEDEVKDLDRGNLGYLATNDSGGEIIEGRAVVVTDQHNIDVTMFGLGLGRAEYEQALVGVIDAILQ